MCFLKEMRRSRFTLQLILLGLILKHLPYYISVTQVGEATSNCIEEREVHLGL